MPKEKAKKQLHTNTDESLSRRIDHSLEYGLLPPPKPNFSANLDNILEKVFTKQITG